MLIYDALKKDHDEVLQMLSELISLADANEEKRSELVQKIRDALVPHARAEEAVFYNSLRAIDSAKDIVMHGFQEHFEAEALLRTLQLKDKVDSNWRVTAEKLRDSLAHHIEEEEGRIFSVAKQVLSQDEAEKLGAAFEQMKPEIQHSGFMRTTFDLISNMMPPRFKRSFGRSTGMTSEY